MTTLTPSRRAENMRLRDEHRQRLRQDRIVDGEIEVDYAPGVFSYPDRACNDLPLYESRIAELEAALKIVAAGIWRDKKMNACGLAGAALAVHAVEEALKGSP